MIVGDNIANIIINSFCVNVVAARLKNPPKNTIPRTQQILIVINKMLVNAVHGLQSLNNNPRPVNVRTIVAIVLRTGVRWSSIEPSFSIS